MRLQVSVEFRAQGSLTDEPKINQSLTVRQLNATQEYKVELSPLRRPLEVLSSETNARNTLKLESCAKMVDSCYGLTSDVSR